MQIERAQRTMRRIGNELLKDCREVIANTTSHMNGERFGLRGHDLLTLLVKANMSKDLTDDQRLSDEDVISREFLS